MRPTETVVSGASTSASLPPLTFFLLQGLERGGAETGTLTGTEDSIWQQEDFIQSSGPYSDWCHDPSLVLWAHGAHADGIQVANQDTGSDTQTPES